MKSPVLSVVTTAFNSEKHIAQFYKTMRETLSRLDCVSEIIIVDDGSWDNTVGCCRELLLGDPLLRIVELSRNFGQHPAIFEGLKHARGDLIFLIDSDLEESPSTLIEMLGMMREEQGRVDVIYGVQGKRDGTLQHTLGGDVFYRVFNFLAHIKIPENSLTLRLMTRRYVDALLSYRERALALGGLFVITGFEQRPLIVEKNYKGYTSYDFFKRIRLAVRFAFAFSSKPAMAISILGLCAVGISLLYAIYAFGIYLMADAPVEGWTTLVMMMVFLNGTTITCVGICAIYIAFVFQEVKGRPTTIVKHIHETGDISGGSVEIPNLKEQAVA